MGALSLEIKQLSITKSLEAESYKNSRLILKNRSDTKFNELDTLALKVNQMADKVNLSERELNRKIDQQKATAINSARLASLGEMAGGIAHEINNPMAVIIGNLNIMSKFLDKDPIEKERLKKSIESMNKTSQRIVSIVMSLKNYSRNGESDPLQPEPIKEIIEETLPLCEEKFSYKRVQILIVNVDSDILISCRKTEISQILVNLLNNSFDAVEALTERWVKVEILDLDGEVQIRLTDSGPGIPKESISKIFDPFFSTKEVGKGTGLGLSISYNIMKAHGGSLYIDQECSNTCFVLSFPSIKKQHGRAS